MVKQHRLDEKTVKDSHGKKPETKSQGKRTEQEVVAREEIIAQTKTPGKKTRREERLGFDHSLEVWTSMRSQAEAGQGARKVTLKNER